MSPLPLLPALVLTGAAFILAGAPARRTAIATASLALAGFVAILTRYDFAVGGYQMEWSLDVLPSLGIRLGFGADGLGLATLGLTVVVTFAAVMVAAPPEKMPGAFYACLLLIAAGAIGAFASTDAFFFYMFHELALVPTFLLIGIWGTGDRQAAAWKITIYLAAGSFVLLLGLLGLYLSVPEGARTFDMRDLAAMASAGLLLPSDAVFWLLFLGFGILVSLFPFHTWAPRAYASAPAPAAMLHAGVLKKFGLFGLLKLVAPIFPIEMAERWGWLLLALAAGNILHAGMAAIGQRKLDLMLGYSSVMHMGYAFLGIAAWNSMGFSGAALTMVAHGLSISALFALAGELRRRTSTLDFSELGGLGRGMPRMGLLFGFAAMAAVGLPGFAGFVAELLVFFGVFSVGMPWGLYQSAAVLAVWGVVISAVYMLRAFRSIFMGARPERWEKLEDASFWLRASVGTLLALLLIFGIWPPILMRLLAASLP